jgi:hypothetical protein
LAIEEVDYTKIGSGENIHSHPDGFICIGLAYEGVAYWMIGNNKKIGRCEMFCEASNEYIALRNQNIPSERTESHKKG